PVMSDEGYAEPYNDTIGYPGALVNAVAVAALENRVQNGTYRVADFSSRGYSRTDGDYVIQKGDVEISATGAEVYSTGYDVRYATVSATPKPSPDAEGL